MKVVTSAINTIIALSDSEVCGLNKTSRTTLFQKRAPDQHAAQLRELLTYPKYTYMYMTLRVCKKRGARSMRMLQRDLIGCTH